MFGIYPNSYQKLQEIFDDFPQVESVIIYGSRAMGTAKEGSDIDLALTGNVTNADIFGIKEKIEETTIPYYFDITVLEEITNENLRKHINNFGKIFYQKELNTVH